MFFIAGSTERTLRTLWRNYACAPDWRYMADVTMLCHCLQCICTAVMQKLVTFMLPASFFVIMLHAYQYTCLCPTLYEVRMCMKQWRYCHAGNSAQLTCSNPHCRVTLQYPRGASQVQCSLCNTINTAIDVSEASLLSQHCDARPAEPY